MVERDSASDVWRKVAGLTERCAFCEFMQIVSPEALCDRHKDKPSSGA